MCQRSDLLLCQAMNPTRVNRVNEVQADIWRCSFWWAPDFVTGESANGENNGGSQMTQAAREREQSRDVQLQHAGHGICVVAPA